LYNQQFKTKGCSVVIDYTSSTKTWCSEKDGGEKTKIMLPLRKLYTNLQWHPTRYPGVDLVTSAL
jgi:hypothetical protein